MYVVKVGEYYVRSFDYFMDVNGKWVVWDMILSKEMSRGYRDKNLMESIAKSINGEVIEMTEETTCE